MAMNAHAQALVWLITSANLRFVIPVYQRPYSGPLSNEVPVVPLSGSCMMVKQAQNALAFHSVGREIVQLQSEKFKRSLNQ